MLKQAENTVIIEGILSELDIQTGTSTQGKEFIKGTAIITGEQDIGNKKVKFQVPVRMFAMKDKKDGGLNPSYSSIMEAKKTFVSAAAAGDPNKADRVYVGKGKIAMNDFYNKQGVLVSQVTISSNFISKAQNNYGDKATFSAEVVIGTIKEEIVNEAPTGRLLINGAIPGYNDAIDIAPFVVSSPDAIAHINTHYAKGNTVKINGKLDFSSKQTEEIEEVGFGENIVNVKTRFTTDLLITAGCKFPYDDEGAYTASDIAQALAKRDAALLAKKDEKKEDAPKAKPAFDVGF